MDQVEVDVVGLKADELLIQIPVHVIPGINEPARKLGSQVHLIAIAVLKCSADERFALSIMIGISGIYIIHSLINGIPEHFGRFGFIDMAVLLYRQTHAPESEDG
jgi:hypothetical protein